MRAFWRRGLRFKGEVISPWVGLSLGGLYLAAVAGIGLAAVRVHRDALAQQRLTDARQLTYCLSRYLVNLQDKGAETVMAELRRTARDQGVAYCAVVSSEGVILAHSDSSKVGQSAEKLTWTDDSSSRIRSSAEPDAAGRTVVAARIISPSGGATDHELRLGLSPTDGAQNLSGLLLWAGYILLAVLCLYLLVYRFFRQSVLPLAVIRDRLLDFQEPVAERLNALRLNDSFDQVSTSWNRLIAFVGDMQEQLRKGQLTADVGNAMDGYRSERLTHILMEIPFGVLVIGADQTISFANRAASGMLSPEGNPLENTPAEAIFDEALRITLLSAEKHLRTGQAATRRWTDHTFEQPHGEVTFRFWSIPSERGDAEHIIFVQDVTQAKEAEHARDKFLYHVTHELRTPLTNIRAYAETLSQGVIDDEKTIRECYNVIMGETQRLNRLVEDILNVSQLEVGTARVDIRDLKLDVLLRTVVQDQQGSADGKNIDLALNLPAKTPQVRGDKDRLAVVFTNLIGNAIKYTPEGGRVDIRCAAEQSRVRIEVSDTGIGIRPEDQEKIFEKFYRVEDEQVSAVPGTGLGLAIAQETMRLHGGTILLTSTPGKGSTFTVTLATASDEDSGHSQERIASVEEL